MTFQIGEKVVYPNHGVGTIENISTRTFGSQFERFYLLRLNLQQHDRHGALLSRNRRGSSEGDQKWRNLPGSGLFIFR